jgi:hypothetical protein
MSDYKVSVVSPEEAREAVARLKFGPENRSNRRTVLLEGGLELKGSFEITARDVVSGEVAWKHADDNLITDFGRRVWADVRFATLYVGFQASTEPPTSARCSIPGDIAQIFKSSALTPSNNPATNTKTVSFFPVGTPASNRTLGTIWIACGGNAVNNNGYAAGIAAYALLTPPKTQTTTQTLEVIYKISMSPIV